MFRNLFISDRNLDKKVNQFTIDEYIELKFTKKEKLRLYKFIFTPPELSFWLIPYQSQNRRIIAYYLMNFIYQSIETVLISPWFIWYCFVNIDVDNLN